MNSFFEKNIFSFVNHEPDPRLWYHSTQLDSVMGR